MDVSNLSPEERSRLTANRTKEQFERAAIKPFCKAQESCIEMIPMSDGVKLETVIRLPGIPDGPFPTILVRCCYPGQRELLEVKAQEYAKRGFAFVYQWCRGTAGSEGEWEPNVNERLDGLDTANWLADQPWVKNIGYWGNSYLALIGWCMADAVPEKVKTMFLGVYGVDRHTSAYKDGLFRMDVLTDWARGNAGVEVKADAMTSYKFRPQIEVDEKLWGVRLDWYRDWISNTDRAAKYWQQGFWAMLKGIPAKVKIPLFIREGWYDHHLGSALVSYDLLSEEAKQKTTLQIGPWNHGYQTVIPGEKTDNLEDDGMSGPLEWFYKILVKEEMPEASVKEYVIGDDRWLVRKERRMSGTVRRFYLNPAGSEGASGSLEGIVSNRGCVEFTYDPENPVSSHGAESLLANMQENGSFEQPKPNYRNDVITFVSEAIPESFVIVGAINVRLFVSSDAEDTSFSAKIMEVFPDGSARNVRGSITTLAYRNDADKRQNYEPGEVVEANIRMWDIAWNFRKGSRIRLDISSSDFPQYAVHSNYPGIWAFQEKTKSARQTIYAGEDYPSCVELPLLSDEVALCERTAGLNADQL